MKENIDIIRVFNLVDANGTKLQLRLGRIKGYDNELHAYHTDQGYRWSFIGTKIPMPVRNGTWFNGFPEATMMNWLMDNGWIPKTGVDMTTGKVNIFNVAAANKADENHASCNDTPEYMCGLYKDTFNDVIRFLVGECKKVAAIRVYRYAHGVSVKEAIDAVNAICAEVDK